MSNHFLHLKQKVTTHSTVSEWMNEVIIIMAFYCISEYNNVEKLLRYLEMWLLVSLFHIPVPINETAGLYGQEQTTSKKEAKNWQEKLWKIKLISTEVVVHSLSHVWLFLQPCGLQHTRLPCPSLSPRVCSNSCELCWWCHLFAAGGQSIGALA